MLLDTDFFDGISPRNWGRRLRAYVEDRSKNSPFIMEIQDESGDTQTLQFAKLKDRTEKNGNNHSTLSKLYRASDNISKLAVIHIDEITEISEESNPYYTGEHTHDWLDEHGWLHRNAYVINAKNGNIYNLTFDIAKASDGRTILYATNGKINKVGNVTLNSLKIRGPRQNSNFEPNVAQSEPVVNSFSAEDSEGNELSEGQQEYFKDSKVRDADGKLLVMYRGGNGEFTVFDRKKSKPSNLYGRGFYFTDSEERAMQYGNARPFYLNIVNPLTSGTKNISKNQMRAFIEAVAEDEDYGIENYGYGATVDSVFRNVWGKDDFAMIQDINATAIGDLVAAIELFNDINDTDYDGIMLPTETVTFRSNQAKNIDNLDPTENEDIRYSIEDDLKDNLTVVYNNEFDSSRDEVHIGSSSNFITDVIGAEALENYMPANKAYQAMATEEKAIFDGKPTGENINYHGLGVDGLYDILVSSEEPIAAFADTPSKDNKRENRIVLVTDRETDGGLGVVVEELDTYALQNARRIRANKTITAYTKDNIQNAVADAIAEGRILHIDKKRSQILRSGVKGANYPTAISEADFANNIRRFWENVKWKNSGRSEISFESDIEAEPEWKKVLGQYDSFSAEDDTLQSPAVTAPLEGSQVERDDEANAKEEAERRKQFRSTVNKESRTKLRERLNRLDGRIEGYERTESRTPRMERELEAMRADRAIVERALKAKEEKAERDKAIRDAARSSSCRPRRSSSSSPMSAATTSAE